ncbi:unnamed protein product [Plutella xylostella]|uniref:(diamondback moth) hypothetical protein n=1 Tax=Plutella xylostella TaxID=51655 RepID=A0A8S4DSN1_PLUXY|nr:unnamed protein product [Plutella xylostella]
MAFLTAINYVPDWPQDACLKDGATFDFIIAGGGTAGAIVAQRLTAGGRWTALLVEAGGDPPIDSVVC